MAIKRLLPSALLSLLVLSWTLSANASALSTSDSSRPLPTPGLAEAPRDSLVAWVDDLVWLVEDLRGDLRRQAALHVAQQDSLARRLQLAELRLEVANYREPWWHRWLAPAAVAGGIFLGAWAVR